MVVHMDVYAAMYMYHLDFWPVPTMMVSDGIATVGTTDDDRS